VLTATSVPLGLTLSSRIFPFFFGSPRYYYDIIRHFSLYLKLFFFLRGKKGSQFFHLNPDPCQILTKVAVAPLMPRRAAASAAPATPTPLTDSSHTQQLDDPFAPQVSLLRRQWKWAAFSQFFYTFATLFALPSVSLSVRHLFLLFQIAFFFATCPRFVVSYPFLDTLLLPSRTSRTI
jgi:hypothetical protein